MEEKPGFLTGYTDTPYPRHQQQPIRIEQVWMQDILDLSYSICICIGSSITEIKQKVKTKNQNRTILCLKITFFVGIQ